MSSQTYGIVTTEATLAVIGKTYHWKYLKMMFNSKLIFKTTLLNQFLGGFFGKYLEKLWKKYFWEIFGKTIENIFVYNRNYLFFLFLFWIPLYALKKFFYLNFNNKNYLDRNIMVKLNLNSLKKIVLMYMFTKTTNFQKEFFWGVFLKSWLQLVIYAIKH